jgi:hypothetical protein
MQRSRRPGVSWSLIRLDRRACLLLERHAKVQTTPKVDGSTLEALEILSSSLSREDLPVQIRTNTKPFFLFLMEF